MRVTVLSQWYDPEPVAIPGLFAQWLREAGHTVQVVTGFPNYPEGQFYPGYRLKLVWRETISHVPVTRIPVYPSHNSSATCRAANYLSFAFTASTLGTLLAQRSDVVYVYHPPGTVGLPAMLWQKLKGTPFVFHVQDLWPESVTESHMVQHPAAARLISSGLNRYCSKVYRSAGALAVISPGFKRLLVDRGVLPDKIEVIPNWADESLFYPAQRDQQLARRLGIDGRFNVIYAGNMGRFQGLDTAIRAAALLQHRSSFRLVFLGSGQAEAELRELAERLDLHNVVFLGRREPGEMGPITGLADALLVSLQDLFFFRATIPGKTQVSLACGRPIVMAVRGDASDLIDASGGGITCPPGDVQAMANAFEHLYQMPQEERDAMGARGRAYYLRELSFARGASRLEALLERVATEGRSPGGLPTRPRWSQ